MKHERHNGLNEPRHEKNCFCICENKSANYVTAQLISAFGFATFKVQSLYFLNPKFQWFRPQTQCRLTRCEALKSWLKLDKCLWLDPPWLNKWFSLALARSVGIYSSLFHHTVLVDLSVSMVIH